MSSTQHVLLSPAELAYLHASLSLTPPIRPDGRSPSQFRPLVAETGILPGTNGSARICFADGTEAIVGVKAEVERTRLAHDFDHNTFAAGSRLEGDFVEGSYAADAQVDAENVNEEQRVGDDDWVELTVEIPGYRDDDPGTVFLARMLGEALLADGEFARKLWINRRFHWKLFLDVILISPPLSYPLPLLSLTTHLALLSTRLPRLKSEGDEDPFFDDDWAAAPFIYSRNSSNSSSSSSSTTKDGKTSTTSRPPISLLVMAVGNNIIFDPSKEELAVADVALAVSVGEAPSAAAARGKDAMDVDTTTQDGLQRNLQILSVRTIDPPSRLTPPGVPNATNSAYGAAAVVASAQKQPEARAAESEAVEGVWKAPRGGARARVMAALVLEVLGRGGVADEVMDALDGVDLV
ncbi:ribosomal protein S5 domain 2-type protein [Bombardia bombarda]|uniref:Ribosomal RNA-processing protein 42 n=1 Tax=Bombardia bombarda TaxID=252184 RepID=A0AA39XJG2_9PEZI|nr:ribosomal protein S5 domain 2-type protein [Bombardia bombarda]